MRRTGGKATWGESNNAVRREWKYYTTSWYRESSQTVDLRVFRCCHWVVPTYHFPLGGNHADSEVAWRAVAHQYGRARSRWEPEANSSGEWS